MPQYQLVCRYGFDDKDPDLGVVDQIYPADRDLTAIIAGHPERVVVPFDGDLHALERYGDEPGLLGDPPTAIAPDHDELDKAGIPHTIVDADGKQITHPLRIMAGKVYPDNRARALDDRPFVAPREWSKDMLAAYAAQERWLKETSGITVNGVPVPTDRESQLTIEKLASRASRDSKFAPSFKAADGSFRDVGNQGLVQIADAVSDHVAACFAAEEALKAEIQTAKVTHRSEVDKAFASL